MFLLFITILLFDDLCLYFIISCNSNPFLSFVMIPIDFVVELFYLISQLNSSLALMSSVSVSLSPIYNCSHYFLIEFSYLILFWLFKLIFYTFPSTFDTLIYKPRLIINLMHLQYRLGMIFDHP